MKKIGLVFVVFILLGCARVMVETKDPIRVDINMRLDVYQHVVQDVNSIEEQIYGDPQKQMNSIFRLGNVYAADKVQEAINRRRERVSKIESYFRQGYIGENKKAYLEIRKKEAPSRVKEIVELENEDRRVIYRDTARKNNAPLSEVKKVFFKSHYRRASSGWYFEVYDSDKKEYVWQKK